MASQNGMKIDKGMGRHWGSDGPDSLILFLTCLLAAALASQRFLDTLFLARLQVEGMTLDLLNDVFLLHLALETAESILEGFTLLESYFSQPNYTPKLVPLGPDSYCKVPRASQGDCRVFVGKNWAFFWFLPRKRVMPAPVTALVLIVMSLFINDLKMPAGFRETGPIPLPRDAQRKVQLEQGCDVNVKTRHHAYIPCHQARVE